MKSILSLGIAFIVLISSQIYLEQLNRVAPEGTDTEHDSIGTRYKIQNGRSYYLSRDNTWVENRHFVLMNQSFPATEKLSEPTTDHQQYRMVFLPE